jgi:hypothetical protein
MWNSSTRSSTLALPQLLIPVDYGAFRYFSFVRVIYYFVRQCSCNNKYFIVTFGITVNSYVCMCGNIVAGHTCDEYLVLVSKPGISCIYINLVLYLDYRCLCRMCTCRTRSDPMHYPFRKHASHSYGFWIVQHMLDNPIMVSVSCYLISASCTFCPWFQQHNPIVLCHTSIVHVTR